MGFLSKIKNKLTGGWAEVTIDAPSAKRGESTTITVDVDVKGEPIAIEAIAVQIRERLQHPVIDSNLTDGVRPEPRYTYHHEQEVEVAGPQVLPPDSHHRFTATFRIPSEAEHASPSGPTLVWQARAVLSMEGNDPDSGWDSFMVS